MAHMGRHRRPAITRHHPRLLDITGRRRHRVIIPRRQAPMGLRLLTTIPLRHRRDPIRAEREEISNKGAAQPAPLFFCVEAHLAYFALARADARVSRKPRLVMVAEDTRSTWAFCALMASLLSSGLAKSVISTDRARSKGICRNCTSAILPLWITALTWTLPQRISTGSPVNSPSL